jgi:hypothetical protein
MRNNIVYYKEIASVKYFGQEIRGGSTAILQKPEPNLGVTFNRGICCSTEGVISQVSV